MAKAVDEVPWDVRVTNLSDDYIACRESHDWKFRGDFPEEMRGNRVIVFRRRHECARCGTKRSVWWNAIMWRPVSRSYDHPDDYKLTGEAVDRGAINRERLMRTNPEFFSWLNPETANPETANGNKRRTRAKSAA
jgi:hypothetical protein